MEVAGGYRSLLYHPYASLLRRELRLFDRFRLSGDGAFTTTYEAVTHSDASQ